MSTLLVTGGTGFLGRPTVDRLRAAGHTVRVLSRRSGQGLVTGDLTTGRGLRAAAAGVDTVVHLATSQGRKDVVQTQNLLGAVPPSTHVLYMSIVGADRIPLPYYRYKVAAERLVESREAFTILRATQFHTLLDTVFSLKAPVIVAPAVTLQPIAVEDVAIRLTELAGGPAAGRVPDVGGPEREWLPDLARAWKAAHSAHRPVLPVRAPGKLFRAFADGAALVDGPPYGTATFADHLGGKS
ncbi:NAD-dependent epimerase/dehydratase family protein [Kribbella sandramycini]|uniref:NAD-dependent epimerase/dehydratase family protein n=1 Tax=Kribbella sandramycini TaxID=60450 RepID=A0A7Y4KW06_9ACTN|nr:NAD(P)H-binding protein [Kribbella sandramycini]MBB6567795.1 uncharacterized protein YbjT (DUF2867 family) [Kribbella sandramycini]NOL39609.1 NAD-dependent epimerase/dehydratase family protein [Kribbella sandramycini]